MHCDALGREVGLGAGRELDGRGGLLGRGKLGRGSRGLDRRRLSDGSFQRR